ncbi:hypothetical protein K3495_g16995, partial [Podosphaera aphanis]
YRPGRLAVRPDALSRREQDMPQGIDDHRLKNRELKLIKDTWISALNSKQPMESMTENTTEIPDSKLYSPMSPFKRSGIGS